MSDDDDWEFTALEEDKRTVPELVIELGGKSYADVVLQRQTPADVNVANMPHEIQCSGSEKQASYVKFKPNRKQELKRQSKAQKEEKLVTCILKRKVPTDDTNSAERQFWSTMAEDFALSEACSTMMERFGSSIKGRMAYTNVFDSRS
ncbi:Hypothetical protein NTJ_11048 [Nesidiocoris tenuis]|uniref:Uncharacterized protein n=1 Tax=Nesidiocoris tenuis TaxID=355587 RepID=A0ABN7B1D8_9HEMI|nr:Hypothetical protein NTJ_11048 [Nesidiocoris tenuis]